MTKPLAAPLSQPETDEDKVKSIYPHAIQNRSFLSPYRFLVYDGDMRHGISPPILGSSEESYGAAWTEAVKNLSARLPEPTTLREKIDANIKRTGDWRGRTPEEVASHHELTEVAAPLPEPLCEDEGCPQFGTPHVCNPTKVSPLPEIASPKCSCTTHDIDTDCPKCNPKPTPVPLVEPAQTFEEIVKRVLITPINGEIGGKCGTSKAIGFARGWHFAIKRFKEEFTALATKAVPILAEETWDRLPDKNCPRCNYPLGQHGTGLGIPNAYIPCEYCWLKERVATLEAQLKAVPIGESEVFPPRFWIAHDDAGELFMEPTEATEPDSANVYVKYSDYCAELSRLRSQEGQG